MKKLLIGLFIFGSLVMGTQVHASVSSILKDVSLLKSKLGAVLYYSGTDGYTRNTYDYVGSGGVLPSPVTPTSVATTTPTTDLTPRISAGNAN